MMPKSRPTKDVDGAIRRLQLAADSRGLIAFGGFYYNGSIAGDLLAVLQLLDSIRTDRSARTEVQQ